MNRFPTLLPPDIVFQIFSYLGQRDCIELTRVCHQWHVEIPLYAIDLWKSIEISPESWKKVNDSMLRCLGSHVQDVSINKMGTFGVLKKLKRANCEIRILEIKKHRAWAQDSIKLLSFVKQFENTLSQLHFHDHLSVLTIPQLLDQFPNLTHLTLLFNRFNYRYLSQPTDTDTYTENNTSNLVYLHVDAVLHFEDRIIPALHRCKKLQTLRFSPTTPKALSADSVDRIFQLCPRIRYFNWNDPSGLPTGYQEMSLDSNLVALQTFIFRGDFDNLRKLRPVLENAEHSLEHLKLVNQARGVTPVLSVLSKMRFPRLKRLTLNGAYMTSVDWGSFLDGFQDIRFVDIRAHNSDFPVKRFIEAANGWKYLQGLCFQCLDRIGPPCEWSKLDMLSTNPRVQELDLKLVRITDRGLLDICKIRSLEKLSLHLAEDCQISLEMLLKFARELSATVLYNLELIDFENLDDSVLERLARVKSLSLLSILGNDLITYSGVKAFACYSGSESGFRRVQLGQCRYIDGFWDTKHFLR